jgi:hypothetical protein
MTRLQSQKHFAALLEKIAAVEREQREVVAGQAPNDVRRMTTVVKRA